MNNIFSDIPNDANADRIKCALETSLRELMDITGSGAGSIMVKNHSGSLDILIGVNTRTSAKGSSAGIAEYVFENGIKVAVSNLAEDTRFKSLYRRSKNYSSSALLSVPVISDGITTAVINLSSKKTGTEYTGADQQAAENTAADISGLLTELAGLSVSRSNASAAESILKIAEKGIFEARTVAGKIEPLFEEISKAMGASETAFFTYCSEAGLELLCSFGMKHSTIEHVTRAVNDAMLKILAESVKNPCIAFSKTGSDIGGTLYLHSFSEAGKILVAYGNFKPESFDTRVARSAFCIAELLYANRSTVKRIDEQQRKITLLNDSIKCLNRLKIDPEEFLALPYDSLKELFSVRFAALYLEECEQWPVLFVNEGESTKKEKETVKKLLEIQAKFYTGAPISAEDKRFLENEKKPSMTTVPLYAFSEERLAGLLFFIHREEFPVCNKDHLFLFSVQLSTYIENVKLFKKNESLAITDGITGVYNHRYFQESIMREIRKAKRYSNDLSLILLDIDHFKKFNDTYGHQQGDLVLSELAKLLKESVREFDIVARYGGEEFAIIVPYSDRALTIQLAERIRKDIETRLFTALSGKDPLKVTASFGISVFNGSEKSFDMIAKSDKALYKSKELGRNRVEVCDGADQIVKFTEKNL